MHSKLKECLDNYVSETLRDTAGGMPIMVTVPFQQHNKGADLSVVKNVPAEIVTICHASKPNSMNSDHRIRDQTKRCKFSSIA